MTIPQGLFNAFIAATSVIALIGGIYTATHGLSHYSPLAGSGSFQRAQWQTFNVSAFFDDKREVERIDSLSLVVPTGVSLVNNKPAAIEPTFSRPADNSQPVGTTAPPKPAYANNDTAWPSMVVAKLLRFQRTIVMPLIKLSVEFLRLIIIDIISFLAELEIWLSVYVCNHVERWRRPAVSSVKANTLVISEQSLPTGGEIDLESVSKTFAWLRKRAADKSAVIHYFGRWRLCVQRKKNCILQKQKQGVEAEQQEAQRLVLARLHSLEEKCKALEQSGPPRSITSGVSTPVPSSVVSLGGISEAAPLSPSKIESQNDDSVWRNPPHGLPEVTQQPSNANSHPSDSAEDSSAPLGHETTPEKPSPEPLKPVSRLEESSPSPVVSSDTETIPPQDFKMNPTSFCLGTATTKDGVAAGLAKACAKEPTPLQGDAHPSSQSPAKDDDNASSPRTSPLPIEDKEQGSPQPPFYQPVPPAAGSKRCALRQYHQVRGQKKPSLPDFLRPEFGIQQKATPSRLADMVYDTNVPYKKPLCPHDKDCPHVICGKAHHGPRVNPAKPFTIEQYCRDDRDCKSKTCGRWHRSAASGHMR